MSLYRLVLPILLGLTPMLHAASAKGVAVTVNEATHRVDITVDGAPFTSYLWGNNQRKPILYPLISPDGVTPHSRQPAAARRTNGPSPPHRPLVQPLQRQQH